MAKGTGTARRISPRTMFTGLTALLCVLVSLMSAAGPAGARESGLLDVTCTPPSSNTVVYSTPLTLAPQSVGLTSSVQLGPCVSVSTPALTSGTSVVSAPPASRSCLDLLSAGTETRTVTWNTGATSALSLNRTVTVAGAALVVTFTGTVTSGLFAGDTVLMTITGPSTDITLCTLGLGTVPSTFGLVALEITSA
ncbi:hypothetical protein [Streptomyces sp. NPDC005012]|uniref:hypothetical protein n=1 Tax=Streptomyces sp. NPDC005012 TaxID=3154558 RepID=UPI0033B10A3C